MLGRVAIGEGDVRVASEIALPLHLSHHGVEEAGLFGLGDGDRTFSLPCPNSTHQRIFELV